MCCQGVCLISALSARRTAMSVFYVWLKELGMIARLKAWRIYCAIIAFMEQPPFETFGSGLQIISFSWRSSTFNDCLTSLFCKIMACSDEVKMLGVAGSVISPTSSLCWRSHLSITFWHVIFAGILFSPSSYTDHVWGWVSYFRAGGERGGDFRTSLDVQWEGRRALPRCNSVECDANCHILKFRDGHLGDKMSRHCRV